jgi:hypothetical protein
MENKKLADLGWLIVIGLLGYIAYSLSQQSHYQIAGGGDVVWKIDTQSGSLERCYPKADALPTGQTYVEVVCDPDN